MGEQLYSKQLGRFLRSLQANGGGQLEPDSTIDASLFAVFYFGCFAPDDEMVVNTIKAIEENLAVGGGVARFQNDGYMRVSGEVTGNIWFICTLWLADYYIAAAKIADDLAKPLAMLRWIVKSALPSGVLAEQMNPLNGEHVSVSPLTWSHSTFIATVESYMRRKHELES